MALMSKMTSLPGNHNPENVPADGARGKGRWLECALAAACLMLLTGGPAPGVNEAHYLVQARHYWNPGWCGGDFFLQSQDAHHVFFWTIGWLTQWLSLPAVAWVGRSAAALLLYASSLLQILALCANISDSNVAHIRMLHQEKMRVLYKAREGAMDAAEGDAMVSEIDAVCSHIREHDKKPRVLGVPMTWSLYYAMLAYGLSGLVPIIGAVAFG